MYSQALSASLLGVDAFLVRVEVHVAGGTAFFRMAGLPAKTVREAERRVRAALSHGRRRLPPGGVTVNLAPADLPKDGAALDLAIGVSLALLGDEEGVRSASRRMFLGELALDGRVRPVRGALAAAVCARDAGLDGLVVPQANLREARAVGGIPVWGVRSLPEAVQVLEEGARPGPDPAATDPAPPTPPDLRDVRGQLTARRALEVAAAGGHNLLFQGPPGTGKSMLAARLPGILPELDNEEALEATLVHSAAGTLPKGLGLLRTPPFRAPHHTISYAGLLGGGPVPRPGEVSLAHRGVLFLDEMMEFQRRCLEGLRQPMETGTVHIVRRAARAVFPARFQLIGACNPCPCGWLGDPRRECRCTPRQIECYASRLSGPLLDRFDLVVEVPAVPVDELLHREPGEPSAAVRQRVAAARRFAAPRHRALGIGCNAALDVASLEAHARPDTGGETLLRTASDRMHLSARAVHRVLRVARTVADLAGRLRIGVPEIAEALQFRDRDKQP